ncbi:hypothetical protein GW17_00015698 [Ensete ventricosum]|nr:hypothetical protein GW17_00015698 [Ensete ventricosum]
MPRNRSPGNHYGSRDRENSRQNGAIFSGEKGSVTGIEILHEFELDVQSRDGLGRRGEERRGEERRDSERRREREGGKQRSVLIKIPRGDRTAAAAAAVSYGQAAATTRQQLLFIPFNSLGFN